MISAAIALTGGCKRGEAPPPEVTVARPAQREVIEWDDYTGRLDAVENLRLVMDELQVADVKAQVGISLFTDFEDFSVFKPAPKQEESLNAMLDQIIAWGGALDTLREKRA